MSIQNTKSLLHIATRTWIKDSNGLFDYESKKTKNLKAFIGESISITRKGYDLNSAKNNPLQKNEETLFTVIKSKDSIYKIENKIHNQIELTEKNFTHLNNKIWFIINNDHNLNNQISPNHFHNINKDYYITKNDIIKLGRVKYIVSEVNMYDNANEEKVENLNIIGEGKNYINELNSKIESPFELIYKAKCLNDESDENKKSEEKQLCKICYSEEIDSINNPMVHLCNCKGGLNYAHFGCIKQWMKTKLIKLENNKNTVKSYYIQCFNCEICKTPYPFRFRINNSNKIFDLIDIERPMNTNYIILESLNQIKENCNVKSIHVISLINNDDIYIGRGHDCDVRIKDISVSRYHCKLICDINNKTILIKDLKSKFGTLALIKTPFEIKDPIQLQIGRTYIKTSLVKFEDLINFNKRRQIEKNKKIIEKEKIRENEQVSKMDNKYEQLETEYKDNKSEKLENNDMVIEDK